MFNKFSNFVVLAILCLVATNCMQPQRARKEKSGGIDPPCVFTLPYKEILTYKGIDSVLNLFEKVKFKDLDASYKHYSDPDKKFVGKLATSTYYIVQGDQVFLPLVGKYRVKDFIVPDKYYQKNMKNLCANDRQYWLTDKKMLYMMLDLIKALDKRGYNKYGFDIRVGHRHPYWNKKVWSGAKFSQHIYGKAVDIKIHDVNKDKRETQKDKKIVLELLETIVSNKGGIGKYPGCMNVHFDSRGFKARWDHQ
jgi:uncharacterized protein YcbK (DUF882 family)